MAAAVFIGVVTLGSSWVISRETGALARRNEQAFEVARTSTIVAKLNAMAWGGIAGRVLRDAEVDSLVGEARQATREIARLGDTEREQRLATEIDQLLRSYGVSMKAGQHDVRARRNPESSQGLNPFPEYQQIDHRLAVLQAAVQRETPQLASQARLATWIMSIGSFSAVLAGLVVYSRRRQRLLAAELSSAADARFRALVQAAPDLVIVVSPSGAIDYASPSLERLLGTPWLGLIWSDLIHPDDLDSAASVVFALGDGASAQVELRMRAADGMWREVSATVANQVADPVVGGYVVNAHDVSEEKRLERELRQSAKMQAVGQLAGGIAHDFNNILCAILAYADIVAAEVEDAALREDLSEITTAARRGAELVAQIMAFSRAEVDDIVGCDAVTVVRETTRMLTRTLDASVSLDVVVSDGPLGVPVDAVSLEQVVLNLVVNARDAIDGPGRIVVECSRVDLAPPGASTDDEAASRRHVRLVVRDSGVGMTDEVTARAFEPFFTTKEAGQGTGLGLATVHGIVRRAGGRASIDSTPGRGTAIVVDLPEVPLDRSAPAPDVTPADAHVADPPTSIPGARVLLVEDERAVRQAVQRILEGAGYEVTACEHGPAAVDYLRAGDRSDLDLLLTDMVMPGGLTGVDVANAARTRVEGLAVVYMSGYSREAVENRGVIEPGVPLVPKPVSRDDLLAAVAMVLADHGRDRDAVGV